MKWNELTTAQQKIVREHFKTCMEDDTMECQNMHQNIIDFWEKHKEIDYPEWVGKS